MLQIEFIVLITPSTEYMYLLLINALFLIATNKILVDILFLKFGQSPKTKLRIDDIIEWYKESGKFKYK